MVAMPAHLGDACGVPPEATGIDGVTQLVLRADARFRFRHRPGQFLYVKCTQIGRREWCVVVGRSHAPRDACGFTLSHHVRRLALLLRRHPFTITSAPQDDCVTVHIAAKGDWTRRLFNLAALQGPQDAATCPSSTDNSPCTAPACCGSLRRFTPWLPREPSGSSTSGLAEPENHSSCSKQCDEQHGSSKVPSGRGGVAHLALPMAAPAWPRVYIDGPYGAPAQVRGLGWECAGAHVRCGAFRPVQGTLSALPLIHPTAALHGL